MVSSRFELVAPHVDRKLRQLGASIIQGGAPGILIHLRAADDTETWTAGVGDQRLGTPINPDGSWRIACASMMFTALVAHQLISEGTLDFSEPVNGFLPYDFSADKGVMTIRHLLSMTSGIPNYVTDHPCGRSARNMFDYSLQRRSLVNKLALVSGLQSMFEPGSRAYFSETNFLVLQAIIESRTGRTLSQEVNDRIAAPLGLHNTVLLSGTSLLPQRAARGYMASDNPSGVFTDLGNLIDMSDWYACGTGETDIVTNASDLSMFLRALTHHDLLGPDGWTRMQETFRDAGPLDYPNSDIHQAEGSADEFPFLYGSGIGKQLTRGGWTVGHDGDDPGFNTQAWSSLDGTRQLVVMINLGSLWRYREMENLLYEIIVSAFE